VKASPGSTARRLGDLDGGPLRAVVAACGRLRPVGDNGERTGVRVVRKSVLIELTRRELMTRRFTVSGNLDLDKALDGNLGDGAGIRTRS
jgi:hypothetical protein